jgi:uncharacterized protein YgiB involved in biofilm formation
MSSQNPDPQKLQAHPIRRKQVQQQLAISSLITLLSVSGCSSWSSDDEASDQPTPPPPVPQVPALFYETTAQCEADAQKQQTEYATKLAAYEAKTLTTAPQPPALEVSDCEAQMAAAKREHDRHAPVYQTLAACQADGVQCETTPARSSTSGYRPVFAGTYLYPYAATANSNFAGGDHRVYQPYTVYQGANPGQLVTPQGDALSKAAPGRTSAPQQSVDAPTRPAGHAAQGTITGRSRSGFGSSFKSTGHGGK